MNALIIRHFHVKVALGKNSVNNNATNRLTAVTDYVTHVLTLLIEGRIPDAILFAEQGAAPARGLANHLI